MWWKNSSSLPLCKKRHFLWNIPRLILCNFANDKPQYPKKLQTMMKRLFLTLVAAITAICSFAVSPSGTLPVLHINTAGNAPITSKEDYLTATYYLDAMGLSGYASIGSAEAPLTMQIRGRGNYTWTGFNKKPYRLKLDSKQPLLGMKKSKHFGLLANADDNLGFLRNAVGFEVSRRIGLAWTPAQRPVEVILNGDYIGLYFLTELIRVDSDRVDIVEQADEETDAEAITGGWLVEIDNYDDPAQVKIRENCGTGEVMRFTYKTPEVLSDVQKEYLINLVKAVDAAIYADDKTSTEWQKYIDINELVKFYITQEVTDNGESFHGSCYWHKERGTDTKLIFGPVWDFGNSFWRSGENFIYEKVNFHQHWIGEIAKFPAFQDAVKARWEEFKPSFAAIESYIDDFTAEIASAAVKDAERWPEYGNADMTKAKNRYLDCLRSKVNWLNVQWSGSDNPSILGNLYMVGASSVLGSWQPADAPRLYYDEEKLTYSRHFDRIDKLNDGRGFKIIDRRSWSGCYEMCGNGTPLKLNEDYVVSTTVGDPNIELEVEAVENVDITLRQVDGKWVLKMSDENGAVEHTAKSQPLAVRCRNGMVTVTTTRPETVEIYSLSGARVASLTVDGEATVTLPMGLYILRSNSGSQKLPVR